MGWHAVVLSLCATLPPIVIAPAFMLIPGFTLPLARHIQGGVLAMISCAVAHLLIYGTDETRFIGIRKLMIPPQSVPTLRGESAVLLAYSTLLVLSVALPYRYLVSYSCSPWSLSSVGTMIASIGILFLGTYTFMSAGFPDTVEDKIWVNFRGMLAGFLLSLSICIAMFF
jgi:hypothetical protein